MYVRTGFSIPNHVMIKETTTSETLSSDSNTCRVSMDVASSKTVVILFRDSLVVFNSFD